MSAEGELRQDLEVAWEALADKTLVKKAITTLEERLGEGETVVHLASATLEGSGTGLLVLTGRRLFFYARNRRSTHSFDVAWRPGLPIAWSTGWLTGTLKLVTEGARWEFQGMNKADGQRLAEALRTHVFSQPNEVPPTWYASAESEFTAPEQKVQQDPETSVIDALERLGALYERGILEEDEFTRAKVDLLARLSRDSSD